MGKLINIDNGGTLTDICVFDGATVHYTKTLTTPYDLSRCFIDGLRKVSRLIYGEERLVDLLASTDCIRYSTTQGTNALVERKGQRLGLVLAGGVAPAFLLAAPAAAGLYTALVGERVGYIDSSLEGDAYDAAVVAAVNGLTAAGANRLVVSLTGPGYAAGEARFKRAWLRLFPRHLLGAVPALFSHEIACDRDDARRTWTALFNAFLHPAMESFLYHAEQVLRENKHRRPLLIFRNDGDSARVAKTIAVKTYSSGPRGGMEGARALAAHHGLERLVSLDVGGTTTDIGTVEGGEIRVKPHGEVEGVPISFPLGDVVSIGAGGSSIIRAAAGEIAVGPESVGAAPGPACFGLGGTEATITDAFLLSGVLDAASFFGGDLRLDRERAEAAVRRHVAGPLGLALEDALLAMERAWAGKIAGGLQAHARFTPSTVLAAFGGAGPLEVCRIAEQLGVMRVIVPGLAAVFSALGIGFSDIAHNYEVRIPAPTREAVDAALEGTMERARRDMFAEGFDLSECTVETRVTMGIEGSEAPVPLEEALARLGESRSERPMTLSLRAVKRLDRARFASGETAARSAAAASGWRRVLVEGAGWRDLPVYRTASQPPGAAGSGPALIEDPFFVCRVPANWSFEIGSGGDILLSRGAGT